MMFEPSPDFILNSPERQNQSTITDVISELALEDRARMFAGLSSLMRWDILFLDAVYLRKALNTYLTNDGYSGIATTAIEAERQEDNIGGLDAFDKDYYKSKFIVYAIDNSLGGGKDIQIIFQDKPDRVFNAWVYKLADGEYELRGFYSLEGKEQTVKDLVEDYKIHIFDKEYAL